MDIPRYCQHVKTGKTELSTPGFIIALIPFGSNKSSHWKLAASFLFCGMHNHWYTLNKYWEATSPKIIGAKITQVFTYEKNLCTFILLKDRDRYRIDYAGNGELPYCVVKSGLNIPRRRVTVLTSLEGKQINAINMIPSDRVLSWELKDKTRLLLEFYGGNPNIFYTDDKYQILDSFKEKESPKRLEFRDFSGIPFPLPDTFQKQFKSLLTEHEKKSLRNSLTTILPHWTNQLARETIHRAGIPADVQSGALTPDHIAHLTETIREICEELTSDEAYISVLPEAQFSMIRLTHDPSFTIDKSLPIFEAYPGFIGDYYRGKKFRSLHSSLKRLVGNRLERTHRRIEHQKSDLNNWKDPAEYRKFGDLLMAVGQTVPREPERIEVDDIIETQEKITIDLDPELSVIENAQRYYEKAKKSGRGKEKIREQLRQSEKEISQLSQYLEAIDSAGDLSTLENLRKELDQKGIASRVTDTSEPARRKPYTEYTSPDGWTVLVGRTARDNDELTFHIAHKEDFWFHAEHAPGSHVIAVPDNKHLEKPPPATLEFAASLAAGYSQAKHSGLVPVVYTKRKYVTKPRDAGPGKVRYQYEESVLVEPKTE